MSIGLDQCADQARAALQSTDDLTTEQKQSQNLHIGLAALFSFLQYLCPHRFECCGVGSQNRGQHSFG
jgi:hypothetical protein